MAIAARPPGLAFGGASAEARVAEVPLGHVRERHAAGGRGHDVRTGAPDILVDRPRVPTIYGLVMEIAISGSRNATGTSGAISRSTPWYRPSTVPAHQVA